MCFLIERGNQVAEFQVSLPASIQHVADRISKRTLPVAVLQRIEKKKTLCSHYGCLFVPTRCSFFRDQLQRSANRFHAGIRSFRGLASNRRREGRERGERRLLFEESWILRVAETDRCQRGGLCYLVFWH